MMEEERIKRFERNSYEDSQRGSLLCPDPVVGKAG